MSWDTDKILGIREQIDDRSKGYRLGEGRIAEVVYEVEVTTENGTVVTLKAHARSREQAIENLLEAARDVGTLTYDPSRD